MFAVSLCAANSTTTRAAVRYMQYSRLSLLIDLRQPCLVWFHQQQIVDDWTLFFGGLLGLVIVMHSLRHLTVYVKQPMNSSSLK